MVQKNIDIIIPCFNEEGNIRAVYDEIKRVESKIENCRFTCLFINDGSTDGTLGEIKELAEADSQVKYISFSRNFGKEAAMYAGICNSHGDYAVIMDADLQHPPALIKDMLDTIESTGCDCCAARRVSRRGEARIRSICARIFYKVMNKFSDIDIADGALDFRLMNRNMVRAIRQMPENQRFSKGIFAWVGFDTRWVEFENVKRIAGESKWSVFGLIRYAMDGFINFAVSPLKFTGWFGGIVTAGSALYLICEIIKTLVMGRDTPGYASTICLILFFGGMIIAILSIIGEYIGRMYIETKGRPVYIEKESNIHED